MRVPVLFNSLILHISIMQPHSFAEQKHNKKYESVCDNAKKFDAHNFFSQALHLSNTHLGHVLALMLAHPHLCNLLLPLAERLHKR